MKLDSRTPPLRLTEVLDGREAKDSSEVWETSPGSAERGLLAVYLPPWASVHIRGTVDKGYRVMASNPFVAYVLSHGEPQEVPGDEHVGLQVFDDEGKKTYDPKWMPVTLNKVFRQRFNEQHGPGATVSYTYGFDMTPTQIGGREQCVVIMSGDMFEGRRKYAGRDGYFSSSIFTFVGRDSDRYRIETRAFHVVANSNDRITMIVDGDIVAGLMDDPYF